MREWRNEMRESGKDRVRSRVRVGSEVRESGKQCERESGGMR